MAIYKELLAQKHALDQRIAEAGEAEMVEVLVAVRKLVSEFSLTAEQVFPSKPERTTRKQKTAKVRYRHPETSATWTGRGREPAWIAGQDRSKFAV